MTEANAHLLLYATKPTDGEWRYPFAEHDRWMNWAQNTCELHRRNTQKDFNFKTSPDDTNMYEADLCQIVNKPDRWEFRALLGRMSKKAFFYKSWRP
jgi:hypothetical protein